MTKLPKGVYLQARKTCFLNWKQKNRVTKGKEKNCEKVAHSLINRRYFQQISRKLSSVAHDNKNQVTFTQRGYT